MLATWRHGLEGADRDSFEKLTIGEILAVPPEAHLDAGFCKNLSAEAKRVIPAGSTLIARKKSIDAFGTSPVPANLICGSGDGSRGDEVMQLRDRLEALEAELAALRASRSWRLTAPIRALHRRWQQLRVSG